LAERKDSVKVNVNGKEIEAEQIGFQAIKEPFAEYLLDDGNVMRIKLVLTKAFKTGERNTNGEPVYSMLWGTVAVVDEKQ
jgi:hypothetical protein